MVQIPRKLEELNSLDFAFQIEVDGVMVFMPSQGQSRVAEPCLPALLRHRCMLPSDEEAGGEFYSIDSFLGSHMPRNTPLLESLELVSTNFCASSAGDTHLETSVAGLYCWKSMKSLRLVNCSLDVMYWALRKKPSEVLFPELLELEVCYSQEVGVFKYVLERLPIACPRLKNLFFMHDRDEIWGISYHITDQPAGSISAVQYGFYCNTFELFNLLFKFKNALPGVNVEFRRAPAVSEVFSDQIFV